MMNVIVFMFLNYSRITHYSNSHRMAYTKFLILANSFRDIHIITSTYIMFILNDK